MTMKATLNMYMFCLMLTVAPRAVAQPPDQNAQLMEGLFTKIAKSLTVGTNTPAAGKSILLLANPGVAIDPALNPLTSQDDRRAISRVLDRVPAPNWIFQDTTNKISSVYGTIMQSHEVPLSSITTQQVQQLKTASATLFKDSDPAKGDSDKRKRYKEYRAKYEDQVNAVEAHRAANGTVATQYTQARQAALQDWKNLGYKNEVETAQGTRDSLTSLDPNFMFQQLNDAYTNAQESPGSADAFYPAGLYPSYASWGGLKGWSTITLSEAEIHNLQTSDHTSSGGSVGVNVGLWSFNAGAAHSSTDEHTHSNIKVSNISMEVIRVTIDRPWLEGLIFRSRTWRWAPNSLLDGTLISDGATPPGQGVTMPFLPTAILVSRNVIISGQFSDVDTTFHHDHTSVNGSVGFGPWAVGGHYEEDHTRNTFDAIIDNNGIKVPGMQIIGWYSEVLPKSPNPDLVHYTWPHITP